jgi:hypothetical protein
MPGGHGVGIHYAMMQLALKYDVSVKVIEETILRSVLSEVYGFKCDHKEDKIIVRKDRGKHHCKWCWTFVEITQKPRLFTDTMGREQSIGKLKIRPVKNEFEDELRANLKDLREDFIQESGK